MLDRCAPPKPVKGTRKRLKALGKRQEAKANRLVYAAVDARDMHRCRLCHLWKGDAIQRHHIVYRSQGGPTTTANVISVCVPCHTAIHAGQVKLRGSADQAVRVETSTMGFAQPRDGAWAFYESVPHE